MSEAVGRPAIREQDHGLIHRLRVGAQEVPKHAAKDNVSDAMRRSVNKHTPCLADSFEGYASESGKGRLDINNEVSAARGNTIHV